MLQIKVLKALCLTQDNCLIMSYLLMGADLKQSKLACNLKEGSCLFASYSQCFLFVQFTVLAVFQRN